MRTDNVDAMIEDLGHALRGAGMRLATAESCTGGLVACSMTNVAGSSEWFEGGVVAYDNRVKMKVLGVPEDILLRHGAVSAACVEAMAQGVAALMETSAGLAISGVAGPGGGSVEKPVGTVWIAWIVAGRVWSRKFLFAGDRLSIKAQSMVAALEGLLVHMKNGAF